MASRGPLGATAPAGPRSRAGWMAAYALVTFLAFPHPVAGGVLDLGVWVAWLAPACLVLALRGLAPGRAARLGFLAGLVAHTAVLHWIYVVTVVYGHAPVIAGLVGPVGLAAYIAVFPAFFGAGTAWLAGRGVGSPWALAALWAALDHLRSFFLTGFPWATLGYAQWRNEPLLGIASYTGVYGLSFATALAGAGLALWLAARAARPPAATLVALAGVGLAHGLGALAMAAVPDPPGPGVRVAVVQGNIDQGRKWSPEWADRTLGIYEELSRAAAGEGARVVVWPETAVPGFVDRDPVVHGRLSALAQETGAALVVGGVGTATQGDELAFFDSAFAFSPDGALIGRYDKTHLVPFGEYLPLRSLLGGFLSAVARGIAPTDVSPGDRPRALSLPGVGPGAPATLPAGVPICYELIFPDLMRRFVGDGAALLLAITNDAWYGRTGAPFQFLAMTALRSAENRVWTARAANTGVSAFIDARGRVREQTRIFERGYLVADVPLRPTPSGGSFYTRHGDLFAWGCWLALAGIAARQRLRRDPGTQRGET